ncbi:MAG TPA: recombinase family protein [Pirellulales bacterium]|jgi:DNA invertase Pin-like site-specific DNA recombinase
MSKQYVAFARVSSREQEREGFSLDVQEETLRRWVDKAGGTIVRLFKVAETASKKDERKTFKEMLAYCRANAKTLDGVLFAKVDRAARNLFDYCELERLESEHGVRFISVTQPTEANPAGRMMRRTLASMASFFTEQMAVDIRGGIERRVREGWFANVAPYGYKNVRENGRGQVVVHERNGPNVIRLFELFATGTHTIDSVCAALRDEGRVYRDAMAKFPRASVYTLLRDRAYIGEVRWKGQYYAGKHPPLTDHVTFQKVQTLLGVKTYKHHAQFTYAGGLIRCGCCGNLITAEQITKKSGKQYVYYRCTVSRLSDHPRHRVTERELNEQVLSAFRAMKQDDETTAWFGEVLRARTQDERRETQEQATELQRQLTRLRQQQDELLNLRLLREIEEELFARKGMELRDRIAIAKGQLDGLDVTRGEKAEQAIAVFELSQSLIEKWVAADYAAKRQILDIVFSNFRLDAVTLCYEMRKPFALLAEGLLVSNSGESEIRSASSRQTTVGALFAAQVRFGCGFSSSRCSIEDTRFFTISRCPLRAI